MRLSIVLFVLLVFFGACREVEEKTKTQIVCTTGMLADLTQNLCEGLDSVEVLTLMGPGTDPHLYKASQADVMALSRGDLIIYNGLHLEGKMQDLFSKLSPERVYAAAGLISKTDLIYASEFEDEPDPHVWFDLTLWSTVTEGIEERLGQLLPDQKDIIRNNAHKYLRELKSADSIALITISQIPENQRVLITAHDAFKYYGRRYGIEVRGLQGISTTAELGIRDISELANYIYEKDIPTIFVESSVSPRAIEAVQERVKSKGKEVKLGGTLYSDALGSKESEAGTFMGMFLENTKTIVEGLK